MRFVVSVFRSWIALLLALGGLLGPSGELEAVTITEIMYHPADADEVEVGGRSLEWIEIYNEEPAVLNLEGYHFSDGIVFTFPYDTYLDPYSYLVVCADVDAVRAKYGITNVIGDFSPHRLDNGGETIVLNIFGGGPEVTVRFNDSGQWPHAADGTGHSLSLEGVFLDPGDNDNWTISTVVGGTPGGPNTDEPRVVDSVLMQDDEVWRYLEGTAPFAVGWRAPGFDDSGWATGRTGIGYGDGDDRTELPDMSNGYWSFAARKTLTFSQAQLDAMDDLVLQISYDDGFVAYLNGAEVARGAMSGVGSPVPYDAAADLHEATGFEDFVLPTNGLVAGDNVLAVEIHNNTFTSSDASFIPRLLSRTVIQPAAVGPPVPVVINEFFSRTDGGRWVELHNTSAGPVDLSGFFLSDDRNLLAKYAIPPGTSIPARGFLTFGEAETGLNMAPARVSIFLTRPELTRVVDGQVFERQDDHVPPLSGTSDARYPDGDGRFYNSTTPTPDAANEVTVETDVVIHEIMYHPPRERPDMEYVELYNRGAVAVDVSGFRFNRGVTYTLAPDTVIGPGDYLIVAANPAVVASAHGISGVQGPFEGVLSDRGERIRLVDLLDNIVDEVHYYDGGEWPEFADGGGSSLELRDPWQDNSVGSAWAASDESAKSQWEEITFNISSYTQQSESELHVMMLAPAEVLIDAIEIRRGATQYIPNGGFEASTSGWIIQGNHIRSHRTTEDAYDGNACLRIVATGDGDTRVNRIERETSPAMTSGSYTLTCAVRWQRGGNLIYFGNYNQIRQSQFTHWMQYPPNLGTPGAPNSMALTNQGPVMTEVSHSPAVPPGGQIVRIRARIDDADGIAWARARYRPGSPGGSFSAANLLDDGSQSDGVSGDGLYGGTIPGQGNGNRVVYYIEAEDTLGNRGRFPADPSRVHTYVHDSPLSANSFTVRLVHDDATWSELNLRQLHSNELLNATFIFNESLVYYNVGTRFRGSPWNRPPSSRMYRVRFPRDNLFRGRKAVNMSRYGNEHRERAAYYSVWRNSTASIASPMSRGAWARFKTNVRTDTMEIVDPVNQDYLDLWFPRDSDGIVYKITGKLLFNDSGNRIDPVVWATYGNRGGAPGNYRWNFNHRTGELDNDFSPLSAMMAGVNSGAPFLDEDLENIMDVEQILRVYAARCAHDDWDTISIGNGQNAYFYWAPIEGRMKLLPWDLDHSWGNTGARLYPDADSSFARVVARPKWRRRYQGILHEMVNTRGGRPGHWRAEEMVSKVVDRNNLLVGSDGVGAAGSIRNFVNARRGALSGQVPASVSFSITTNSGNPITVDDVEADLSGRGWVDVYHVTAGENRSVELTWTGATSWRAQVPVLLGEHEVQLTAFDVDGAIVGSDSIVVTSTVGWDPPTISTIEPPAAKPGDSINITGIEFHNGLEVFFDGAKAPTVVFDENDDPTSILAQVPLIPDGPVPVTVRNIDGRSSAPGDFVIEPPPPQFIRGDANIDRSVNVGDVVTILLHLYRGVEVLCGDAADVNDDEVVENTDAVFLLEYLFLRGAAPGAPFPDPGFDSPPDVPLDCQTE